MKASEFIEKLKELLSEFNESNDVVISDIDIEPHNVYDSISNKNIGYSITVKFED